MVHEVFGVFLGKKIIQAIDFNGGGYRNRTGVHGFKIAVDLLNYQFYLSKYTHRGSCVHFCVRKFCYYIIKTSIACSKAFYKQLARLLHRFPMYAFQRRQAS